MLDIGSWLVRLGLAKYADVFAQNEIDLDTVRHLSDDDLKELGLPIGPRRKVMAAVIALSEAGSRADVARSAHTHVCEVRPSGGSSPSCLSTWSAPQRFRSNPIPRRCAT
jgi:hypothetical protein